MQSAAHAATATANLYGCGTGAYLEPCEQTWGGECKKGWLGVKCVCKDDVLGAACDWRNASAADVVDNSGIEAGGEGSSFGGRGERIMMAYDLANLAYLNLEKDKETVLTDKCPGLKDAVLTLDAGRLSDYFGEGGVDATYAAVLSLKASATPSKTNEVAVMFRGTEFSQAKKDVADLVARLENGTAETSDLDQTYNGLKTVVTDLSIDVHKLNVTYEGKFYDLGFVHQGFYTAVAKYIEPLLSGVLKAAIATELPNPIVNVVGHSLGGALATIFTSILRAVAPQLNINLITFGSPRVGDAKFNQFLQYDYGKGGKLRILRMVNGYDPVSMIPTALGFNPLDLRTGLVHAGDQFTLSMDTIEPECKSFFIESQWDLFNLPKYIGCLASGVGRHTDYHSKIMPWLTARGVDTTKLWCSKWWNF